MPKAVVDANPSNQYLALEPENVVQEAEDVADETITDPLPAEDEAPADEEAQDEPVPASPPGSDASRQEWADYAAARGATPDEIANMTTAELAAAYGGS